MSRLIRVATAGCVVLGLALLVSTPAAQAKGHGGGHSSGHSHSGKHMGSKDHRNHRVDYRNRRNDWRYRYYPNYCFDNGCGCGCGSEVESAPAAMAPDSGCQPTCDAGCGYVPGCEGGYDLCRKYNRSYRGHGVSYRGGMSRGGHSHGGHGRK
ncbi:MAG TPA: hypothetical protein VHX65_10775 [Pirellulales bacterium]|jgi:hypothetical protein|nr:hypothetical protein [Pirellulales bacterium]